MGEITDRIGRKNIDHQEPPPTCLEIETTLKDMRKGKSADII